MVSFTVVSIPVLVVPVSILRSFYYCDGRIDVILHIIAHIYKARIQATTEAETIKKLDYVSALLLGHFLSCIPLGHLSMSSTTHIYE